MPSSPLREKEKRVLQAFDDPMLFAEVMLGHQLWSRQRLILKSVANHARTAVRACHASSKTFTAAAAVLWWITRIEKAIALTTGPTWNQVERQLWGEIRNAVSGARIKYPQATATSLQLG